MTLKTKYNFGDKLWFVAGNKIRHLNVMGVQILYDNYGMFEGKIRILYSFFEDGMPYSAWENEVYATKEELFANS